MIASPHLGQTVQIWYRKQVASSMPFHAMYGLVSLESRGKPRNHLVRILGRNNLVVVPCGNLREPKRENV